MVVLNAARPLEATGLAHLCSKSQILNCSKQIWVSTDQVETVTLSESLWKLNPVPESKCRDDVFHIHLCVALFSCGSTPNCSISPFCLRYNIWRNFQHPVEHHCKARRGRVLTSAEWALSDVTGKPFQLLCLMEQSLRAVHCPGLRPGLCSCLFPIYSKTISKLLNTFVFLIQVSGYTKVSLYQHLRRRNHLKYWYCWQK